MGEEDEDARVSLLHCFSLSFSLLPLPLTYPGEPRGGSLLFFE